MLKKIEGLICYTLSKSKKKDNCININKSTTQSLQNEMDSQCKRHKIVSLNENQHSNESYSSRQNLQDSESECSVDVQDNSSDDTWSNKTASDIGVNEILNKNAEVKLDKTLKDFYEFLEYPHSGNCDDVLKMHAATMSKP